MNTKSAGAAALRLTGVSKTYGPNRALDDLRMLVQPGEIHALMGGNGSGKSTTVKILAGVVRADTGGTIALGDRNCAAHRITPRLARELGLRFVHQDIGVFPQFSVAENLAIGSGFESGALGRIAWRRLHARARRVLARFDLDVDPAQPLGALSLAQRTQVAIARALQDQEEASRGVLVLDEPTAALSAAEVDFLLDALRRYAARGQTILLISHRLDEVLSLADTVTVLRDGVRVTSTAADALDPTELTRLMIGSAPPRHRPATRGPADGHGTVVAPGRPLLEIRGGGSGFGAELDIALAPGEVLGLAGRVGSGRSRLLRTLFGLHPRWPGTIRLDGERVSPRSPARAMALGFAMVPEDRPGAASFPLMSVVENVSAASVHRYWRHGRLDHRSERRAAERLTAEHQVVLPSMRAPLEVLSGGNQQKVILARWLRTRPRVLLLDEPTQGVDVGARDQLHQAIRATAATGVGALVASSDVQELASLCDRVLVLDQGAVIAQRRAPDLDPAELAGLAFGNRAHPTTAVETRGKESDVQLRR